MSLQVCNIFTFMLVNHSTIERGGVVILGVGCSKECVSTCQESSIGACDGHSLTAVHLFRKSDFLT